MAGDRLYQLLKKADAYHSLALARPRWTGAVRALSYAAYRGIELGMGERHPHGRVLAQAAALASDATQHAAPTRTQDAQAVRVLFVTLRGWYVHSALQAVLAKALERRGARSEFLLCGGGFSQCDFKPATDSHVTRPLCLRCKGFTQRLLSSFRVDHGWLDEATVARAKARADSLLSGLSRAHMERFSYDGLPLFDWCLASIRRSLLRGDAGEGDASDSVVRGYLESAIVYVEAARQVLARARPDVCVMLNGLFHAERIFLEVARSQGIRVVSYEQGWRPRTVHFVHDKPAAQFPVGDAWMAARDRPLTAEQDQNLEDYLCERMKGGGSIGVYWPKMDSRREEFSRRLGIEPDKPMAVLFPNITWDSATFRQDRAFAGLVDWVAATIELFAKRPDKQLVIRAHPAELRLAMMESRDPLEARIRTLFPVLPANVRVVPAEDPTDSYELLSMSELVLVYTSTLGIEATARGRRVIVAGTPHYAGRGFTQDIDRIESYAEAIDGAFARPHIGHEEQELARRYAYMLLFSYMTPFPWVIDTPRADRRLDLSSLSDLDPGKDASLDRLCDGILRGTPFFATP